MRLFVAVDLPDAVRAQLRALMAEVKGARWVPEHQLHLTLRFIGEVEEAAVPPLETALHQVRAAPFSLALAGVGRFPDHGPPRVLWAGLEPRAPIEALAASVERALVSAGLAPEPRAFAPHVTLARLKDTPPFQARRFLEEHARLSCPAFEVASFCLYRSQLGPKGATHTVLRSLPLALA